MSALGIGLIGTGYMGKAHALAYRTVKAVFGGLPDLHLTVLCDTPEEQAQRFAKAFGFARFTADWREVVSDPDVAIVSVTTPNHLHKPMSLAALQAGKHVWCEKPMALTVSDAAEMARAARDSGAHTLVGYNYLKNPAFVHARRLIDDGAIGRLVHFRGWVDEDYQADPDLPWSWRAKLAEAGLGALGDLGCHLVSLAYGLVGPIDSLIADMQIVHPTRPLPDGEGTAEVENEDTASALVRFESGVQGSLSCSRSAWGRKNRLAWEVHGTAGMLCFDQERMNELQIYRNAGARARQGFTTILTGPEHPPYGAFCPAPGHQLGFNDLKVIEAAELLTALRDDRPAYPDFDAALEFESVIHAIVRSAKCGTRTVIKDSVV